MKRENYVAPNIKVMELTNEPLLGGESSSGAKIPIDDKNTGTKEVGAKGSIGNWSDEGESSSNAWSD